MAADKGKKQKLNESDEDNSAIDGELVLSIEKLQEAQDELDKINEEACEKVLEVELKANQIRKPIYDKRNQIINSIPDFWLTAFLSHPAIGEVLTEEDQKIFKYLSNIEVEDSEDLKSGYSITLNFKPNPYFEDTKLTKAYAFSEEGTTKITATPIKWKEGMGITNGDNDEKNGKKRSHEEDSFFTWFSGGEFKAQLDEISDEIADFIKDDLWPNPLAYFNNDADEEDLEMDDDDENEGKGSDGSEDEEEDDEDED